MKQIVKLRVKKLANYQGSYYLDWCQNGKRNYEYLKLYIDLSPNASRAVQAQNKQIEKVAMNVRNQREIELMENKLPNAISGVSKDATVFDYLETKGSDNQWRDLTIRFFKKCFGGKDYKLKEVTNDLLRQFREYMVANYASSTANATMARFKMIIRMGIADGLVVPNALSGIDPIKIPQETVTYLTVEELKALKEVKWANETTKRMFFFSCFTGLRFSDIKKLKWSEITEDYHLKFAQKKTQSKNGQYTFLPLSSQAVELLGERQNGECLVFPNSVNNMTANTMLHNVAKKCGIEKYVHFHMARHTLGVTLLSKGVEIYTVSKLLGHASVSTTERFYANLTDKKKEEGINQFPTI